MNNQRKPAKITRQEEPVVSFTRVIAVAPRSRAFDGWGPSRWN